MKWERKGVLRDRLLSTRTRFCLFIDKKVGINSANRNPSDRDQAQASTADTHGTVTALKTT